MEDLLVLERFPNLQSLNLIGTPLVEEKGGDFKKEFLILMDDKFKNIKMINKEEVTKEDIDEAKEEKLERIKQAEEEAR